MIENDNLNLNNDELEPEQKRKVFIGSLSYRIDENTFRDYWTQFGTVLNSTILRDREGHSRGFGFVTFDNSASVDAVMKARPHTLDNRVVEPKRAVPREASHKPDMQLAIKKLYLGGIKEPLTEDDLKDYFSKYGNIINVTVTKDRDGKYRGYGFIEFDDYDSVDKIILEKNHIVSGHQIDVQKAQSKDNAQRSGGNIRSRPGPSSSMSRPNYNRGYNNYQQNRFNDSYGQMSNNNYSGYNSNFNEGNNNRPTFGQGYNQDSARGAMRRGNMRGGGSDRNYTPYNRGARGGRGGGNNQGPSSWTSWD
ncbi:unnamed protein product [Rotaria sp. Silwood1]|nr:unnamed protein product [Rotaria sp. Silwood1]CAF1646460.1 unnamed protein product [Rotaria sp. Silwood1]CAF3761199.1 unnamed protein product [Rotaria sp. Silwood1]CAF3833900.1 unnamed protein product [Rotaria sp. Silwood1]CAF3884547.1 unnamed protein product [Rotaria sp. Silwood1]